MADLPFADGVFDAVIAYWSLIHVPTEEHQTVIDEFARVLRPGGRVRSAKGPMNGSVKTPTGSTAASKCSGTSLAQKRPEPSCGTLDSISSNVGASPRRWNRARMILKRDDNFPRTFFAAELDTEAVWPTARNRLRDTYPVCSTESLSASEI